MLEVVALLLATVRALLRSQGDLVAENLLLRHQTVLTGPTRRRPRLRGRDMALWKPNVWHCGPWAAPSQAVRFFTLLSGHRKAETGENVDHIVRRFAPGVEILPDVDTEGRPR